MCGVFKIDHVIGKRVVHRMKERVLVMEGDTLWKVLSLSLLVFFSLTLLTCLLIFSHGN